MIRYLKEQLRSLGLRHTAEILDDLVALATKNRWGAQQVFEHVARIEAEDRARRSLERRIGRSKLGKFKPMADFDWDCQADRPRGGRERRCPRLHGEDPQRHPRRAAGARQDDDRQNIANAAVLAGHSALFTTAAQMLLDLGGQESTHALDQRLRHYCTRTGLLVIDEIGYLSYDNRNADLLFQVVSRRYVKKSVVLTTNLPFSEWPTIFPNATCTTALIDRLVHHAEIISLEGQSYRRREAELAKDATALVRPDHIRDGPSGGSRPVMGLRQSGQ